MTAQSLVQRRHHGPANGYRCLFVPVCAGDDSDRAVAEACLLAASGGVVYAVAPVEMPLELPLEAPLAEAAEADAHEALARARAIGLAHGVTVRTRIVRARSAGEAAVAEAAREHAEVIVVQMHRSRRLDHVAEYVLRHAECRVLVAAT